MDEKILNSIVSHQMTIKELRSIQDIIESNTEENTEFYVKTRHLIGYSDIHFIKCKTKLKISNHTMKLILKEAIKLETEHIDKLIDMAIDAKIMESEKLKGGHNG